MQLSRAKPGNPASLPYTYALLDIEMVVLMSAASVRPIRSVVLYTRGGPCQHGFMSGSKQ